MTEENFDNANNNQGSEIDILELVAKLWSQRRKVIKWCCWGIVVGLVIAFSIPKEYTTEVTLAPEIAESLNKSGLGSLAAMAGVGGLGSMSNDALYPMLYPDVVSSLPFLTDLLSVEVKTNEDGREISLKEYMEDDLRSPWWSFILRIPGKIIGLFTSKEDEGTNHKLNNFRLSKKETELLDALSKRVVASVDNKTMVVSVSVQMQDPLVSAMLADTVVTRLQKYITAYRTNKARQDLEYHLKLNEEARDNYYKIQREYAEYLDRNQGLAFNSTKLTRERLQNEAQLAFSLYNQTSQKVQMAQAKVQETTPVYAIINPPTVPIKPTSPRKMLILIGFTFLSFVACAAWILFLQPKYQEYKEKLKLAKAESQTEEKQTKETTEEKK